MSQGRYVWYIWNVYHFYHWPIYKKCIVVFLRIHLSTFHWEASLAKKHLILHFHCVKASFVRPCANDVNRVSSYIPQLFNGMKELSIQRNVQIGFALVYITWVQIQWSLSLDSCAHLTKGNWIISHFIHTFSLRLPRLSLTVKILYTNCCMALHHIEIRLKVLFINNF